MVQTSSANATAITSIYYEKDQHYNSNNTSYTNNSSNNSSKFNANTATMTLLPFTHNKVGGHCPMFRLPYHQAICKAVTNTNERLFYKDILHYHPQFIPFLPHYMGSMRLLSSPSRLSATSAANTATAADLFASVTTPDAAYLLSPQLLQQQEISTTVQDIEEEEYIILEDLTAKYRKPSLLDLKMGVRQHSCYARASKIASQTLKCENSTSRKLGVRLCGSQVNISFSFLLFASFFAINITITTTTFTINVISFFFFVCVRCCALVVFMCVSCMKLTYGGWGKTVLQKKRVAANKFHVSHDTQHIVCYFGFLLSFSYLHICSLSFCHTPKFSSFVFYQNFFVSMRAFF